MAILFALVARGSVVLAEFTATATNASAIARQILEKIPGDNDSHVSYSQDRYIFHVKRTDGLTVLCMADDTAGSGFGLPSIRDVFDFYLRGGPNVTFVFKALSCRMLGNKDHKLVLCEDTLHNILLIHPIYNKLMLRAGRIPFAFLEDIHQRFVRTYGRAVHSAQAYAMNDEFSRVLSQQIEYYSNDPNADRINRLKGEMTQVRNVMIENIDKVLERGDRLELLVDKTVNMQGNTFRFRKQARRFRNTVWWRNVKLTVALIVLLLVIVYVVLAFVCHGLTLPTCL